MRLAWATDVHLNFLSDDGVDAFCARIAAGEPDVVALTGDIAEADSLEPTLLRVEDRLRRPIWFVLGNHDFYGSSIGAVRARAAALTASSAHLRWLPTAGVLARGSWGVVGVDGWGDGRLGDPTGSRVFLNDWLLIQDLVTPSRDELLARLRALGDEAGRDLARLLADALRAHPNVLVLTHVPPFREAAWYDGRPSNDEWLPWFSCQATGDALRAALAARPDRRALVLCGHTHGAGDADVLANLHVKTGAAEYGAPVVTFLDL